MNKLLIIVLVIAATISCTTVLPTAEKGPGILPSTPWVTTAVYKQVNGKTDKSKNYINDDVAQGTVSSAQYSDDQFVFVPLDTKTGKFDLSDTSALVKNSGKYELLVDGNGRLARRVYDTRFNYTHTRVIEHLSNQEFTYVLEKDGETYYVEHLPYSAVYPQVSYPAKLQAEVDRLFSKN